MNSFSELLNRLGTRKVAQAVGVTDAAVSKWKSQGRLPVREGALQMRTAGYEKKIAKLAGISVGELRKQMKSSNSTVS